MLWDPFGPSPTKPVAKLLGEVRLQLKRIIQLTRLLYSRPPEASKFRDIQVSKFLTLGTICTLANLTAISPDGLYIASCSFDNSVKLWNARDGKFILTFRGHVAPVYQCAFSAGDCPPFSFPSLIQWVKSFRACYRYILGFHNSSIHRIFCFTRFQDRHGRVPGNSQRIFRQRFIDVDLDLKLLHEDKTLFSWHESNEPTILTTPLCQR